MMDELLKMFSQQPAGRFNATFGVFTVPRYHTVDGVKTKIADVLVPNDLLPVIIELGLKEHMKTHRQTITREQYRKYASL